MYLRHGDISWDSTDGDDVGAVTALESKPAHGAHSHGHSVSRSGSKRLKSIDLHGIRLHTLNESQCITHIMEQLSGGYGGTVVTPNLDHLRRCVKDLHFGALVAEADLVVADGMPLVWASRLQGTPLPERVAGSNLISSLTAAAAQHGRTVFLLGGAEGTAAGAATLLAQRNPGLKIVGTLCPRVGFDKNPKQMAEIARSLTDAMPDIVYVALGSPKQEHLIAKLRPSLPAAWWLGVGVSFSFLTGHVRRAPLWMQRGGIEWMHRLGQEPRRLFKRYILVGIPFAAQLLSHAAVRGIPQRLGRPGRIMPRETTTDGAFVRAAGSNPGDIPVAEIVVPRSRRNSSPLKQAETTSLAKLKALVLLGGHVRPTPLSTSTDRSLLDLPLGEDGSVLNHWLAHAASLSAAVGLEKLPVRVMVDRASPEPISTALKYFGSFRIERDQSQYRGTGGVLGDLAAGYDDDDLILVANAAQILLDPLVTLAASLDQKRGDIAVISHRDGTPSGMMLVRCKTLRAIPKTGFFDMKEQAMPLIAQAFAIEVVHRRRPSGLPIRSAEDYIQALRFFHMRRGGRPTLMDPLAEDWQPAFGIVEEGAIVDPSARVHDSVVLRGGIVEANAVLVRSIVCPGGIVRRDRCAIDDFVRPFSGFRHGRRPRPADKGKAA
jgi:N-acetylglucosaminyldiphosphoundecaprenol N-acetyl-beta-D-mannosaminyltransferase